MMKQIAFIALTVSLSAYGATANDTANSPEGTNNPFSSEGFLNLIGNAPGVTPTSGIGGAGSVAAPIAVPGTPAAPATANSAGNATTSAAQAGASTPATLAPPSTPSTGSAPTTTPPTGVTPAASGAATPPPPSSTPPADAAGAAFLATAYQGGLAEVDLGRLAAARAENNDVKEFAQAMVLQHTIVNAEIQKVAQAKNAPLPTTVTNDQITEVNQLSTLTGADFDRAYMQKNVTAHRTDLDSSMRAAANATDDNVRLFAAVIAPALRIHLLSAEDILNRLDPAAFILTAYQSSLAEVAWAQVALVQTTDARVRRFAEKMLSEHTEANQRIRTLAEQEQIVLPSEITPEDQAITEHLARCGGADFDRAYMDINVTAHTKAVRYARAQMGTSGHDSDVVQLARALKPELAGHLLNAVELTRQIEPSFYYRAYQSNLSEIRLAYLATARSTDSQIISYAQRMIVEHAPILLQLRQLAEAQNNTSPADVRFLAGTQIINLPVEMSPEELLAYSTLLTASTNVFDGVYAAYNDRLHEKAVERFQEEIERPTSAQTQSLAQTLLPTLQAHRNEARAQLTRFGSQALQFIE